MKHYDITQWADFVRDLVSAPVRAEMQEHLSAGCHKCEAVAELFRKVVISTAAEADYEVPQYAVRMAKAAYALQRPEKVLLPRIIANLVFDSFRQPLAAGVRSHQQLSRQALYEAGDYNVDLRLEQESGATSVTLVGQIANRREPNRGMAEMPVVLMSGKQIVARTVTDSFGEFQMQYEPKRHLRLYLPVQQKARIEVRLNGLSKQSEAKNEGPETNN